MHCARTIYGKYRIEGTQAHISYRSHVMHEVIAVRRSVQQLRM